LISIKIKLHISSKVKNTDPNHTPTPGLKVQSYIEIKINRKIYKLTLSQTLKL